MYSDIFSDALCISGAWDGKCNWHMPWAERDLTSDQVTCISTSSILDYHCRLGHPSLPTLKLFILDLGLVSSLECESCQLEQCYHVSYPNRVNKRVDKAFDLVHSDVWGPYPSPSKLRFRYFVSFIYDYSRVTWIYLLKSQFEVFFIFKIFSSEIKNQFNFNIKILRSDNTKEYLDNNFKRFLKQNGILYQSACVHSSIKWGSWT